MTMVSSSSKSSAVAAAEGSGEDDDAEDDAAGATSAVVVGVTAAEAAAAPAQAEIEMIANPVAISVDTSPTAAAVLAAAASEDLCRYEPHPIQPRQQYSIQLPRGFLAESSSSSSDEDDDEEEDDENTPIEEAEEAVHALEKKCAALLGEVIEDSVDSTEVFFGDFTKGATRFGGFSCCKVRSRFATAFVSFRYESERAEAQRSFGTWDAIRPILCCQTSAWAVRTLRLRDLSFLSLSLSLSFYVPFPTPMQSRFFVASVLLRSRVRGDSLTCTPHFLTHTASRLLSLVSLSLSRSLTRLLACSLALSLSRSLSLYISLSRALPASLPPFSGSSLCSSSLILPFSAR